MSRGLSSMTALLGLLAVAGYQNRDKIAEILGGLGKGTTGAPGGGGLGGLIGQLKSSLGGAGADGVLSGGLSEIVDRFKKAGQGETAESLGKNRPEQTDYAVRARAGHRPRGFGHLVETDGIVAG